VQPIAQALYPYLCRRFEEDHSAVRRIRRRVLGGFAGVGLICALAVFLTAGPLAVLLTGTRDHELIVLLQIFGICTMLDQLNVMLNAFILAAGRFAKMSRVYVSAAALFVTVSVVLVPRLGAVGAAYVMLFGVELFVLLCGLKLMRRSEE
jgi:PST family polysaccharide transporter